jgi:hypothetical protein
LAADLGGEYFSDFWLQASNIIGALSAWMRQQYPDLVTGAIASSGPVFAKLDFLGKPSSLLILECGAMIINSEPNTRFLLVF